MKIAVTIVEPIAAIAESLPDFGRRFAKQLMIPNFPSCMGEYLAHQPNWNILYQSTFRLISSFWSGDFTFFVYLIYLGTYRLRLKLFK